MNAILQVMFDQVSKLMYIFLVFQAEFFLLVGPLVRQGIIASLS